MKNETLELEPLETADFKQGDFVITHEVTEGITGIPDVERFWNKPLVIERVINTGLIIVDFNWSVSWIKKIISKNTHPEYFL